MKPFSFLFPKLVIHAVVSKVSSYYYGDREPCQSFLLPFCRFHLDALRLEVLLAREASLAVGTHKEATPDLLLGSRGVAVCCINPVVVF